MRTQPSAMSVHSGPASKHAALQQVGARVTVVECVATDASIWRARIEARRGQACSLHKPQTWEELQQLLQRSSTLILQATYGVVLHGWPNATAFCRYDNCYLWSHRTLGPDEKKLLDTTDGRTPGQIAQMAVSLICMPL